MAERITDYKIRYGLPQDAAALVALEQATFAYDCMSQSSFRRLLSGTSARLLLAWRQDGGLAAYACLFFRRNSKRCRIYSLAVAASERGRGLGRLLCEAAEHEARTRGSRQLSLEVRQDNAAAITLYESLGYRRGRALPAYYSDGSDGWSFVKPLD